MAEEVICLGGRVTHGVCGASVFFVFCRLEQLTGGCENSMCRSVT